MEGCDPGQKCKHDDFARYVFTTGPHYIQSRVWIYALPGEVQCVEGPTCLNLISDRDIAHFWIESYEEMEPVDVEEM